MRWYGVCMLSRPGPTPLSPDNTWPLHSGRPLWPLKPSPRPAAWQAAFTRRPIWLADNPNTGVDGFTTTRHSGLIGRRVNAAAKAAGLGDGFTGHSGRVGMAQDLAASGVELPELMTAGRWKSSRMPAKYTERQAAGRGAVARYYQGRGG